MKITFLKSGTKFGCYAENNNQQNQFLPKEEFTISDVLAADLPLKDKVWFIRKNCQFTTDEYRQFAIGCALCVLPIYEAKYPGNNAPREAIQAAKDYLAGIISIEVLREKRRNAAAAAYAADASAAAAADAYAKNSKQNYQELLLQFFKEFT